MINRRPSTMALVLAALGCGPGGPTYDLVIESGRVIDPETGFFQMATVGIMGDTIATISDAELRGERVIDATGMVVAPGFIDLHEHGQSEEAYGLMVRDGVTTALELEVGTDDVDQWYAAREGGQLVDKLIGRSSGNGYALRLQPRDGEMRGVTGEGDPISKLLHNKLRLGDCHFRVFQTSLQFVESVQRAFHPIDGELVPRLLV